MISGGTHLLLDIAQNDGREVGATPSCSFRFFFFCSLAARRKPPETTAGNRRKRSPVNAGNRRKQMALPVKTLCFMVDSQETRKRRTPPETTTTLHRQQSPEAATPQQHRDTWTNWSARANSAYNNFWKLELLGQFGRPVRA